MRAAVTLTIIPPLLVLLVSCASISDAAPSGMTTVKMTPNHPT